MDFEIAKADLVRELALSQRIVERRNTIPILANILIDAQKKKGIQLTSTDLEVGLRSVCSAEVKSEGSITVSAKKLYEVVRSLPDARVRMRSTASHGVELTCGRASFRLVGLDPKDYPNLPECDFKGAWHGSLALFNNLLGKVLFSATADESRFPISGVLLLASKKTVSLVATDGHRLAIAEADEGLKGISGETRLLLPRKALVEIRQMAESEDQELSCEVKDNHLYFRIGSRLLVARMVEDQFPAYDKVIPRSNDKRIVIEKADLDGAVRRAAVLSSEKARAVKFEFRPDTLVVSASSPELGEAREEVGIPYSGEVVEIAFNAQYVLDFLTVVDTEQVYVDLKDGSTQAILRPSDKPGADKAEAKNEARHFYVLMPMRL